jgi:hypothetical protein
VTTDQLRKQIRARQAGVLKDVLSEMNKPQALAIVKAPPGSGKTELLVRGSSELFADKMRVAVAAQTNAQADDICARLYAYGVKSVIRLAGSADPVLPPGIRIERSSRALPVGPCVVVATGRKWEYGDLQPFDTLFVDEAWQMTWSSFLGLDRVAPRFVLIGDPGQIPPVVTVDTSFWETTRRQPYLAAPELLVREGMGLVRELPASWRLPADSAVAVKSFYDFDFDCWAAPGDRILKVVGHAKDAVDAAIDRLTTGSIVALTLPTPAGSAPPGVDTELARTAVELASRLLARDAKATILDGMKADTRVLKPEDIGFCATHRVMNARMEALRPKPLSGARVDTAERWQGLQRQLMIVVHPLSGVDEPSAFDLDTGRLCVMASRHRIRLVVLAREQVRKTLDSLIVLRTRPWSGRTRAGPSAPAR